MAQTTLTIDRLFDRSSRLPYPLRARTSPARRWCMLCLFVLLTTLIGVYWFVTDARRVREMAESYLSELSGAQVTVGRATLSIFEGLRLDDVRVYTEPQKKIDPKSIRALPIFTASRFQITYNLRLMLRGKLEATKIVATNPHVLMAEDVDVGLWNYQHLAKKPSAPDLPVSTSGQPLKLPEIVLRDARVEYIEVRRGVKSAVGAMSLEGHLVASEDGRTYLFNLQSRGVTQGMGPSVVGAIEVAGGNAKAQLRNFTFGRDIKTMLPALVRTWWEQHDLSGRVDVPTLIYTPATESHPATFKVETELDSVALAVHPNEWMSRDENQAVADLKDGLLLLDRAFRDIGLSEKTVRTPLQEMAEALELEPIRLQKVSGTFVFTEKGIEIKNAGARIENNGFALSGRIDGYTPESPMSLTLSSLPGENLVIPPSPKYVNSMPAPVRELYQQLRPQGECNLMVQARRDEPGERIIASGVVNIVDGRFIFAEFPYPVRNAKGKIEFGPDPRTGVERLEITNLTGQGAEGSLNSETIIGVSGRIAPLGSEAGVRLFVRSDRIVYDEVMRPAFPPPVQNVFKLFDAPGFEHKTKFVGGFLCEIFRTEGYDRDVLVSVDLRIDEASGAMADFPYPMSNVKGLVLIRDDHVDLVKLTAKMNDTIVTADGRISWTPHHDRIGQPPRPNIPPRDLRTDVKVTIANLPIDQTLLNALPTDTRDFLTKLGLGGLLNAEGMLTQRPQPSTKPGWETESPFLYDLTLDVRDGSVKPPAFEWGAHDITGRVQVSNDRIAISNLKGLRGKAKLAGEGFIDMTVEHPKLVGKASAIGLELDQPFYKLIPKDAQVAWDQVRPSGTIDIDMAFNQPKQAFAMTLKPAELSVSPVALPIKLDHVSGQARVVDDVVTFSDLQARNGDAAVWIDGTQRLDRLDWNVRMAARGLTLNDELLKAMPESIKGLVNSIGLKGKFAIDFDKLSVVRRGSATTQPSGMPDIDFSTTLWLEDASMELGVPIQKANGRLMLAAALHNGHLDKVDGGIDAWSLQMAGRDVKNLTAKLAKRRDDTGLRLDDMQAEVAGGTMGGRIDLIAADAGASKYVMNINLRNADVATLTGETETKIEGRLSASLALEGTWGDASKVRGRGDVVVNGKQIVKLPLLLGLFQMANLALPITGPLNDATVRYSIDGPIVIFERIDLKGANVRMSGDGKLDFTKKTVDMRFSTENPGAFGIPLIGPLLESANRELLQIHVRGSVQSPKVSSSTLGTVSTTVDEVLNGDDKGGTEKKK